MKDEKQLTATIVPFYLSEQPDTEGRMIDEIWAWDFDRLEYTHNYIQWLFPLKEKSSFNLYAPILNDEVIQKFHTDIRLQKNLLQSLTVMLKFYGLQDSLENGHFVVKKAENYVIRKEEWINFGNHNYLRITRIIKCLIILGCESYARAFYQCLEQIYNEESQLIGYKTFQYWTQAMAN
ncbi:MAG: opioid growth factor receptor-related protein [Scytonema sp. PMC 1069.18]|nr:opioid growth factor receptor-related protein [Scytonema sp. PMC 1069.18]MEC4886953.1 opioid growth factor receptor-related protein [Scytonema sp. PMC 1070.18]